MTRQIGQLAGHYVHNRLSHVARKCSIELAVRQIAGRGRARVARFGSIDWAAWAKSKE